MRRSYLDYSMSVIIGRALPDVRDGLKPVHRRILYTMQQMGLLPNQRHPQVRQHRRRRHGQVPSARQPRGVRRAGAPGADRSPCAIRWWTDRATSARSTAIRRRPIVTPKPADARSPTALLEDHRQRHRRFRPELRRQRSRARRSSHAHSESAGERIRRHRRRHGDEHSAAQSDRNRRRHHHAGEQSRRRSSPKF